VDDYTAAGRKPSSRHTTPWLWLRLCLWVTDESALKCKVARSVSIYRAIHYNAKHGLAIACHPTVTLLICDHIDWKSWKWKLIAPVSYVNSALYPAMVGKSSACLFGYGLKAYVDLSDDM